MTRRGFLGGTLAALFGAKALKSVVPDPVPVPVGEPIPEWGEGLTAGCYETVALFTCMSSVTMQTLRMPGSPEDQSAKLRLDRYLNEVERRTKPVAKALEAQSKRLRGA